MHIIYKLPLFFFLILFSNLSYVSAQEKEDNALNSPKKVKSNKNKVDKLKSTDDIIIVDVIPVTDEKYKLKTKKLYKKALTFNENGSFYKSIEYLNAALSTTKKSKMSALINYEIANNYFEVRDYKKSIQHYSKVVDLDKKNKFYLTSYMLANALKHNEKYEESKKTYRKFLSITEQNKKVDFERSRAILEIKGCDYALELNTFNEDFTIKNAGDDVNGVYADFGPEIRNNELVFSKILSTWNENDNKNNHLAQIYSAEMYKDEYNFAQKFSSSINDNNMYVCNSSFTKNGEEIYFTKCEIVDGKKAVCSIYYSQLVNGIWIKPIQLSNVINEEGSNTTQPQIVIDENGKELLYFSAERERGRGGKDIFVAEKNEDGSFSRAKNLGFPINTRYDDISPFYHTPTQTLYFSTNGKISLGGFDIYKSQKEDEEFNEPVNLKYPFNTSLDDYDFVMNDKSSLAYLVSNRKGVFTEKSVTCCDDIFELKTTKIEVFVKGIIYLEKDGERKVIQQSEIELIDSEGDGEKIKSDDGTFLFKLDLNRAYKILANSNGFDEGEVLFNTNNIKESDTLQYDLFLDNLISDNPFSTPKEEVKINAFNQEIIGVIYYSFNAARLTDEAPTTLKNVLKYLNDNPNVIVEISAHTDDKGPADFNLNLSKERCYAAANYLKFYGISEDRIVKKWYGETQPIAPNQYEDGSDYQEGRERNRRTEFKAIGEIK